MENAPVIPELFAAGEWGGCNQAYALADGNIGVIGHKCEMVYAEDGSFTRVYLNFSFVLDVERHLPLAQQIIGTRTCYPPGPAKKPDLTDCAFTSGIVMREDGKVDLYSGIGDTEAGRIVIDYPFAGFGAISSR